MSTDGHSSRPVRCRASDNIIQCNGKGTVIWIFFFFFITMCPCMGADKILGAQQDSVRG